MELISSVVEGSGTIQNQSKRLRLGAGIPATARHFAPLAHRPAPGTSKSRTDETERQLVARLKTGNEEALRSLFDRYSRKLYTVAHRILGEPADAEEVVQDVFWTLFRKAKHFRGNSLLSTWLYRLTINAALGRIRQRKRSREVGYDEFLPKFQKDGHHAVRPVVDWSDTVEEKYARCELKQFLSRAVDELKPLDKSIVVLSDVEGMSDREIAVTVGLSVSAVKTRLHRARLFLRGKLAVYLGHSSA